jgi:hypothetical protein
VAYTVHLTDVLTDTLLDDLTTIALETQIKVRLNKPTQITVTLPSDQAQLYTAWTDGDPQMFPGSRGIKVYKDGVLVAYCLVWTCSWTGDEGTDPKLTVTAFDPLIRLQYRNVFDLTGHIADWDFLAVTGTDGSGNPTIDAATLLHAAISSSETFEDNTVTLLGTPYTPATFPIDYTTGTFAATVNIWALINDSPMTIGDLMSTITDTGAADVILTPTDTSLGAAAGVMGVMNVVDVAGADVSGTVHFDYDTGLKNTAAVTRMLDMSTLGNRMVYEIGPKYGLDHWFANVTGTEAGLETFQSLALNSRVKYGTFAQARVYDDDDGKAALPLYHQLWKTETKLRSKPRELVYVTPAAKGDNFAQFTPWADYNIGDLVAVNTSNKVGPAIASTTQRIYGFDVTIGDMGVERVGQLVTSADAE